MPTIELLPNKAAHSAAPGWAYVLEPTLDPSKLPLVATSGFRHSTANPNTTTTSTNTTAGAAAVDAAGIAGKSKNKNKNKRTVARSATDVLFNTFSKSQAAKTRARIEELNRGGDAGRAVDAVDVPAAVRREVAEGRWKIGKASKAGKTSKAGKGGRLAVTMTTTTTATATATATATTTNVKRVLASTKGFTHHLGDELARGLQAEAMAGSKVRQNNSSTIPMGTSASSAAGKGKEASTNGKRTAESTTQAAAQEGENPEVLQTPVPVLPSKEILDALVKTPPLSHSAACAGPSQSGAPARKFCDMCSYWGRMRCTICGSYLCSLACKLTHDTGEHPGR